MAAQRIARRNLIPIELLHCLEREKCSTGSVEHGIGMAGRSVSRILRVVLSFLQVPQNQYALSVKSVNCGAFVGMLGRIWAGFFERDFRGRPRGLWPLCDNSGALAFGTDP
jgi:hypothetical protein